MSLSVYTGLSATGKTSTMIRLMRAREEAGGKVVLFLSAEHPELTRRKNVRPGGLMGCREPGLNFPIDHVLKTDDTIEQLSALEPDTMAVFDEAQFFGPQIVKAWHNAAEKGVEVLIGSPSNGHLKLLRENGHEPSEMIVPCTCGLKDATHVVYEENMTYPTHLCDDCHSDAHRQVISELFEEVRVDKPFPGENKTYQPFFGLDPEGWEYVRPDSVARFEIMQDAINRYPSLNPTVENVDQRLSFMDLGCCSGYFCGAMANVGFSSTGVDVTKNFIDWAGRVAKLQGHNIEYRCEDAKKYITGSTEKIDVTSSFATIQWVMTQQGYEAGLECFKHLFDRTRHICVVEMGYTLEDIYKERIPDRPREIDKSWVLDIMQEFGNFAEIEVFPAGENGIWRDVFVGYKEAPARRPFRPGFKSKHVAQISRALQYWDDKWAGQDFEVFFKALKPVKKGLIKGWFPDRVDGSDAQVKIDLDGVTIEEFSVSGNKFECSFACEYDPGRMFCLRVQSSPHPSKDERDQRPLAFVLNKLKFS
ncbi:MAG: hypothetical protein COA47_13270 [Robiginitomaculum sp.]|nr:MAG: hypothetical protein COA47_13270 [Robiginitomaculum sp.]